MNGVYHTGELTVQKLAGADIVAQHNGTNIKPTIFKGAMPFLRTQSLIIASSVDRDGRVWSSFLTGEPGFIDVKSEAALTITSSPVTSDPLVGNLLSSPEIGLLAIDFNRRIRMRINGKGEFDADRRLAVSTEQVYANCPKYIQKRSLQPSGGFHRTQMSAHRGYHVSPEQQEWIRNADTFFIGSISSEGNADASHRGGAPGFVKVVDENTLLFPDYFGNSMFNTLGNIYSNPSTGLLFIDFDAGHSLQLTGRSQIIWDENEISRFSGAERLVRFEIDEVLYTENGTPIRWDFIEFSSANPTLQRNN
ncbi:pyridoxamine 5'-phosphate oxidase family protein [Paenibacillus sp. V4I5]|uniref:pyridoxamine 5'-phosphate oxidase family protein n=1 Tax=Paenibacillus sp. V4I5 TaxID=3042306 RepID=UPI00278E897D|nr:pyridoxamine 5'-phosphate oxidase family protein [Paenibacillus sp. V4I5]MDQ0914871.1 putative pyridoxine 5'-phosphate oxidase superfamily flavin-nucleotide-binding protein [Paenibacillus sp. V4I5]